MSERHVRLREVAHLLAGMGDMIARDGDVEDALILWRTAGKYKRMANELRAELPDASGGTSPQPPQP